MPINRCLHYCAVVGAAAIAIGTLASLHLPVAWPDLVRQQRTASGAKVYSSAQLAHLAGGCGMMLPGTGLTQYPHDMRGWVASMIPGRHEFRIRGKGDVFVSYARRHFVDFSDHLQYHTIRLEGTDADSVLEWKTPGSDNWEPVREAFLYPRPRSASQDAMDEAIRTGAVIPGVGLTAQEMTDPRRIVAAGESTPERLMAPRGMTLPRDD